MSFPSEKSSVHDETEKGEVYSEKADSAANSISSRQKLAKDSGIKPIFLAKVNRINEAISECGMGTYGQFPKRATELVLIRLFTWPAISGSCSSPVPSGTLRTISGCAYPSRTRPDSTPCEIDGVKFCLSY